jgi:ABC-type polysaccharide/polyol phosphate transport system ATPase subunit
VARPAVVFENVSKLFVRGERHDSLRDLVPALARRLLGRPAKRPAGEFWALRDVSFEVAPGEALGIIGANGAGKSTVLKLLTRILEPTRGRCEVRGRVGALIELSAGFHPDLTGRENVFLQGAIMGMRRREIARKLDEIVDFSGVRSFIDTPVKRYSSGMQARLGFSIAAHLDPDVLLVDEVLAVGDSSFQQRAFERLAAIVRREIPVVVISHQLERVAALCQRAILLDRGRVVREGSAEECIAAYIGGEAGRTGAPATAGESGAPVAIASIAAEAPVRSGERTRVVLEGAVVAAPPDAEPASAGLRVHTLRTGQIIFSTSTRRHGLALPASGPFRLEVELQMNVPPGWYRLESFSWDYRRDREFATGPSTTLEVVEGVGFWGTVQMNPSMRLAPPLPAPALHPSISERRAKP